VTVTVTPGPSRPGLGNSKSSRAAVRPRSQSRRGGRPARWVTVGDSEQLQVSLGRPDLEKETTDSPGLGPETRDRVRHSASTIGGPGHGVSSRATRRASPRLSLSFSLSFSLSLSQALSLSLSLSLSLRLSLSGSLSLSLSLSHSLSLSLSLNRFGRVA
jgi:hypothetical protein